MMVLMAVATVDDRMEEVEVEDLDEEAAEILGAVEVDTGEAEEVAVDMATGGEAPLGKQGEFDEYCTISEASGRGTAGMAFRLPYDWHRCRFRRLLSQDSASGECMERKHLIAR